LSITPLTLVHISLWSADKSSCMNRYPCYIYLHAVYRKVDCPGKGVNIHLHKLYHEPTWV
jgi:hypothetical protein